MAAHIEKNKNVDARESYNNLLAVINPLVSEEQLLQPIAEPSPKTSIIGKFFYNAATNLGILTNPQGPQNIRLEQNENHPL